MAERIGVVLRDPSGVLYKEIRHSIDTSGKCYLASPLEPIVAADFVAYLIGKLPEESLDVPLSQYPPPHEERPMLSKDFELIDPWEPMRHWDD